MQNEGKEEEQRIRRSQASHAFSCTAVAIVIFGQKVGLTGTGTLKEARRKTFLAKPMPDRGKES